MINKIVLCFAYIFILKETTASNYDVDWSSKSKLWEKDVQTSRPYIYCYGGMEKTIISLWQTVKFKVKVKNDDFSEYFGPTPQEVYVKLKEDKDSWSSVMPFKSKPNPSTSVNPFETTCMAINTKYKHIIELQIKRIDLWRVLQMCIGITLILSSKSLSGNPVFFYLCGIFIGVFASLLIVLYYIGRLLPKKMFTYSLMVGGWTVGVFIFQQMWTNIQSMVTSYYNYLMWYIFIASAISFLVCYRIGPPKNQRSKNIVMWILQFAGVLLVFTSSYFQEASTAIAMMTLIVKYTPSSFMHRLAGYWRMKFPPKRSLLTSEEYYEEGARETKLGLENLRKYCASPDCAQWRVMLKLHDSKRFAKFVEGDSHLSDEEIINYESYAFSPVRQKKVTSPNELNDSTDLEISDDDSSQSDSDES